MFKSVATLAMAIGLLAGCTPKPPVDPLPVVNPHARGAAGEDSALEMNQIRQDYDTCIKKYGPKDSSCQELEWTYEDVKARYDAETAKRHR